MSQKLGMLVLTVMVLAARSPAADSLQLLKIIPLPRVQGRLDHLAADVKRQRLFVAARGNNTVEMIDLASGKTTHSLSGFSKPQGLMFVPQPNLLYVTCGGEGRLRILDCDNYHPIKTLGSLPNVDNIRLDAPSERIYVGFGNGALGVINANTGVQTYSMELNGHPESFQIERFGTRIFVNVPSLGGVVVMDRLLRYAVTNWALPALGENFPMALDEANQRLFIGCRKPASLATLDTKTGELTGKTEIAGDTDDLFYDDKRKQLYVMGGEGFVDILKAPPNGPVSRDQRITTRPGARTGLLIPELDLLCVAIPQNGTESGEIRVFQLKN